MFNYQGNFSSRSPQRQLPLFQAPGRIFGMSEADRVRGSLETAEQYRVTLLNTYVNHCASLGRANGLDLAYRRDAKSRAFGYINMTRATIRKNAKKIADLKAKLLALAAAEVA